MQADAPCYWLLPPNFLVRFQLLNHSTYIMNCSQRIEQELDELRERFRRYQVEMALRLDKPERRIEAGEGALTRSSRPHRRAANVPPAAPFYGYALTAPRSDEIFHHS